MSMASKDKAVVATYLSKDQLAKLDRICKKHARTRSSLIRRLIEFLDEKTEQLRAL
jgi:hypothetical protein